MIIRVNMSQRLPPLSIPLIRRLRRRILRATIARIHLPHLPHTPHRPHTQRALPPAHLRLTTQHPRLTVPQPRVQRRLVLMIPAAALSRKHAKQRHRHREQRAQHTERNEGFVHLAHLHALGVAPFIGGAGGGGGAAERLEERACAERPQEGEERVRDEDVEGRETGAAEEDGGEDDVDDGERSLQS